MRKVFQYIKKMSLKQWVMACAAILGLGCMCVSWSRGDDIVAILSFVIAVVPAVIWFSDYKENQKLQQEVKDLNEWADDTGITSIDNPEWLKVDVDSKNKVLFGIKKDGSVEWSIGIPKPIREELEALKMRIAELEKKE